ncbi:MAG: molybdopterin-dependent oxidoreductase [Candidatus Marinimicrobia bacterium]|nr:molybdopterin-dependent oxidoreductase [Candidatus Neomarinimicrobiota bacterium]
MNTTISRRDFIKVSAVFGTLAAGSQIRGDISAEGVTKGFSPSGKERKIIPSACWQCVSRDAIECQVEDGRLVKIEGNPRSIRNRGKICSRGQAGINQVYDPDRILYPMKRVGKRGEGNWKRISWDDALGELSSRLDTLRKKNEPEKFMFHYGRMKASDGKIVKDFLTGFGTGTLGNHTSICEGAKWVAQELTWAKHYDVWDFDNTNLIVNFGSNFFEAHTSHVQAAQRATDAMDRGVKMYTFDVRLSNTAAKSTQWIPVKPGTDLAVMLAMGNVIMKKRLYDKSFIENWTTTSVKQLKKHLKQYTPEWAEQISGVSADMIESVAIQFAKAKPAVLVTYRGAVAHYNGVMTERAKFMLESMCGYLNQPGGTNQAVGPKWKYPKVSGSTKKLDLANGFPGESAFPNHHVNHQVLKMIKDGRNGRPDIYMTHCYNPAFVNGNCGENIEILKDESLIPYHVAVDVFMSETTALADLILPDVTYLERWSWDDMISFAMIPEFYLRQPVVDPLGESRQFQDVVIDLAKKMGFGLGYDSTLDFIKKSCEKSHVDFALLKKNGVWHDPNAKPKFLQHLKEIKAEAYKAADVILDEDTGVYWNWKKSKAKSAAEAQKTGYRKMKYAYKGYIGQDINGKVMAGFKPDKINKSGLVEISSPFLKEKGFPELPSWMPIPEHQNLSRDELILTTYKVAVQTHSRTQNSRWLSELFHDNPGLMNPKTASMFGIKDGDQIKVKSGIGEMTTNAKVIEGIVPGVIAISFHLGHWEYGEFASGKKASTGHECIPDCDHVWWDTHGKNPNWIIPNSPDPIGGQQRWMDTVVTIQKA